MPGDGTCPHCHKPIDPGNFPWRCPVCGQEHPHHNFMMNCENCRFGPRLILCPHCRRPFEALLLIGTFSGDPVAVVPASAIDAAPCRSYVVGRVKARFSEDAVMFKNWDPKVQTAMISVSFPYPLEPKGIFWYQGHVTEEGQHFLHGSLYDRLPKGDETPEPCAQLSLVYPRNWVQDPGRELTAGYVLSDVMAWTR